MRRYLLYFITLLLSTTSAFNKQAHPSPSASSDSLICHDSSECYPRVFNPTPDFQPIHDDQQLPAGLHIRLNLQTGQREARLNIPVDDGHEDVQTTHNDLATVVEDKNVLEEEVNNNSRDDTKSMVEKSGKQPPAYSNHGRIMPPVDKAEAEVFKSSVAIVLSVPPSSMNEKEQLRRALEDLEELAHEIYYGVEIAKNAPLVRALMSLAGNKAEDEPVRKLSGLVLGSAVQNNPSALENIKHVQPDMIGDVLRILESRTATPKVQERLIFLLGNLVKGDGQRSQFLGLRGMERLLEIFDSENAGSDDGRDGVRRRCALFVTDTFLDENMRTDDSDEVDDSNVRTETGAQRVLIKGSTTEDVLKKWCMAFRNSFTKLSEGGGGSDSEGARERIDAALSFPACQV